MSLATLLAAASLPFLAKTIVVMAGLQGYIYQSLYKVFQLLVPVVWRYRQGEKGLRIFWPVNAPCPSLKIWILATGISLGLSAAGIIVLTLLLPLWNLDPQVIRQGFDERFAVGPVVAVMVVVFLSFINSALEELHFRAWLDTEVSKPIGNTAGIGMSALAFGAMHSLIFMGLPGFSPSLVLMAIIGLVVCGILWSLLMRQPGGIHAAWWSHGLTDALLLGWGLHWLAYV